MKNCQKIVVLASFLCLFHNGFSIEVCWFNVPKIDGISYGQFNVLSSSKLYIYFEKDVVLADSILVEAVDNDNEVLYKESIPMNSLQSNNRIFISQYQHKTRLEIDVPYISNLPNKIILKNHNFVDTVVCQYYKLYVKINNKYFIERTGLAIYPDDFSNQILYYDFGTKDEHEIILPKRNYFALFALSESWGKTSLESWFSNLHLDTDRNIEFYISNGEIYNLSTMINKGVGQSLFIYFRPMFIDHTVNSIEINDKPFQCYYDNVNLSIDSVQLFYDDSLITTTSLQAIYETSGIDNYALKAYIIQAPLPKKERTVIKVSFSTTINQEKIFGYAQKDFINYKN